jgi:hypothetical protein
VLAVFRRPANDVCGKISPTTKVVLFLFVVAAEVVVCCVVAAEVVVCCCNAHLFAISH